MLLNDISKMSALGQTSGVEAYHSVLNHFAPKMIKFSHSGMYSRLRLAALHYNENAGRPPAITMAGENRYKIDFPKYKAGGYAVKKILVGATYNYVEDCFQNLMELVYTQRTITSRPEPPPLSASFVKPDMREAVTAFRSRFNHV
ncbi:uncharacterized protein LOC135493202 [Lineus longissimus]|uniref:uncharacterized protein LOC135493202 n=1 Tax=Lineus longissimus TaxID=88925 RepID=UPI00315D47F5